MEGIEKRTESGQSLILVAIFMFVFFAILAIVLDLGFAYYQRRQAQNAADAGALAGARVYCDNPDENVGAGIAAASLYVANNNANLLPGYPSISGGKVTVGTTITHNTFFAQALGQNIINVRALASAGCYQPCLGEGVLPVVWTCKPDDGSSSGNVPCEDLPIPMDKLEDYRDRPGSTEGCVEVDTKGAPNKYACPELTIIMDDIDIDTLQCISTGGVIDCDFDGDGDDDYVSAANRGWADLDGNVDAFYSCAPGSEGSDELTTWIHEGYDCPLEVHTWVSDQEGSSVNIFQAVEDRIDPDSPFYNPIVVLPIFDDSCPEDPTGGAGGCTWHSGVHPPGDLVHEFTNSPNYYHVIKFAAFYITCVQLKNGECPGATLFYEENEDFFKGGGDDITGADYNAIEGYFLRGYVPGMKGNCGDDIETGVFTVHLDE